MTISNSQKVNRCHRQHRLNGPQKENWVRSTIGLGLLFACLLLVCSGCSERDLAPELTYSPDEATQLKEKIDNFEW